MDNDVDLLGSLGPKMRKTSVEFWEKCKEILKRSEKIWNVEWIWYDRKCNVRSRTGSSQLRLDIRSKCKQSSKKASGFYSCNLLRPLPTALNRSRMLWHCLLHEGSTMIWVWAWLEAGWHCVTSHGMRSDSAECRQESRFLSVSPGSSGLICLGLTSAPPGQENAAGSLKEWSCESLWSCCACSVHHSCLKQLKHTLFWSSFSGTGWDEGFSSCQVETQGWLKRFKEKESGAVKWWSTKESCSAKLWAVDVRCLFCCNDLEGSDLLWLRMYGPYDFGVCRSMQLCICACGT